MSLICSAVLGSMNSAIEVKDTPSEDLPLDEDYLGERPGHSDRKAIL